MAAVFLVFLALNLRRALVDHPYRSRALWTGVGALSVVSWIIAGYVDSVFGQVPNTVTGVLVEDAVWGFTFLGLFGWIVTNVNVAMGSDYFNRDALGWKRGGRLAAPVLIVVLFAIVSVPPWWLPAGTASEVVGSAINTVTGAAFIGVVLYAAGVLAITYLRISDRRIKTFTKWTLLSILCIALVIVGPSEVAVVVAVLWAFGMYRAVGSLAIKVHALPA